MISDLKMTKRDKDNNHYEHSFLVKDLVFQLKLLKNNFQISVDHHHAQHALLLFGKITKPILANIAI